MADLMAIIARVLGRDNEPPAGLTSDAERQEITNRVQAQAREIARLRRIDIQLGRRDHR